MGNGTGTGMVPVLYPNSGRLIPGAPPPVAGDADAATRRDCSGSVTSVRLWEPRARPDR